MDCTHNSSLYKSTFYTLRAFTIRSASLINVLIYVAALYLLRSTIMGDVSSLASRRWHEKPPWCFSNNDSLPLKANSQYRKLHVQSHCRRRAARARCSFIYRRDEKLLNSNIINRASDARISPRSVWTFAIVFVNFSLQLHSAWTGKGKLSGSWGGG